MCEAIGAGLSENTAMLQVRARMGLSVSTDSRRFAPRGPMNDHSAGFWQVGDIESERTRLGNAYLEFLRVPALSAGVYVLAAGSEDTQTPHREDELYYVVRGKARMRAGSEDRAVEAGSVIFVAADAEHRFYAIEEELSVLVFFAPAETLA
jgi:mannose-6-phosphate isomerase-like protein (cupin superfamily)